ncbi:MAG TPA: cation transporter [Acidobacteriaceae bacterium]|nr:cation transporter [Acidobacteriaceae bacterium]
MKTALFVSLLALFPLAANAEYEKVDMTVFGMDCAPCAHAIHVSMKGITGVDNVDVDLNTGLVSIQLTPGNVATMHQFNEAVERNGFTHKDAKIVAKGRITGTASAPVLEVTGTEDKYALAASAGAPNAASFLGKTVTVTGVLPQVAKGKIPDALRYAAITEAQ